MNFLYILLAWMLFPTPLLYMANAFLGYEYNYLQVYLVSLLIFSPYLIVLLLIESEV